MVPIDTTVILAILAGVSQILQTNVKGTVLERLEPLIMILISVGLSFVFLGGDRYSVLEGIILGLSSLGLWVTTKEGYCYVKNIADHDSTGKDSTEEGKK